MMIPHPEPFKRFDLHPMTWMILSLNVVLFILIFSGRELALKGTSLFQAQGLEISGRLYYDYLSNQPQRQRPEWLKRMDVKNLEHRELMGAFALRDADFVNSVATRAVAGDEVAIAKWKIDVREFQQSYLSQILFHFGLSVDSGNWIPWITYQFSHASFVHLLSNMVFLVFIGIAVEFAVGSTWTMLVYILSGLLGGLFFLILNSHGMVPMVGASASISGLLSFYWVIEPRARIRFFYFIAPVQNFNGYIYLPTLLILPLFLLSDVASLISTPDGLATGVAYSAHLGGSVMGLVLGLMAKYLFKVKVHWQFVA